MMISAAGHVVMDDGTILPVTQWIDEFGDDVENPQEAVVCVYGRDGYGWFTADLRLMSKEPCN